MCPVGTFCRLLTLISFLSVPTRPVGFADLVGFGDAGTFIALNGPDPVAQLVTSQFGFDDGWTPDEHVRFVADATGDGAADLIGFGDDGVYIALNNGTDGFGNATIVVGDFSVEAGWTIEANPRLVADLRSTGRVDILGFGDAGVYVSLNEGGLNFTDPTLVVADFGLNAGDWTTEQHLRLLADVNGDGFPDIVGFGYTSVIVSLSNGDGTFQDSFAVLQDFTIQSGNWTVDGNPRFLADLTGDGLADIIGFANDGVYVSLNNGNGTFATSTKVVDDFGIDNGWTDENPRFIADLNDDGLGDIVGFGDAGVQTSLNNGDGTFQTPQLVLDNFGYDDSAGGWRVELHPRFMADLNGDGMADIVGFGENSVWVAYSNGNGSFTEATALLNDFGVGQGWSEDRHVRYPADLN